MKRPLCGTATFDVRCDHCGGRAVTRYVDDGRRLAATTSCADCGLRTEADFAPGHPAAGKVRSALLAQSGRWRLYLRVPPGHRRDAIAAARAVMRWPLARLSQLPRAGETLVHEGTYGECLHAAKGFEARGIPMRLEHASGDLAGLIHPPTEAELFAERWAKAMRNATLTPLRCRHCGAPCPSYRRTCIACREAV